MAAEPSVCHVPEGYEAAAARALGGAFKLEGCGALARCEHKVEKFDFTDGRAVYAVWYECDPAMPPALALAAAVLCVLALLAWWRTRRARAAAAMLER
jgi:hypothetical protein